MTCDLTSLNWLSSLDVADRTVAGTVPQLTSTPARGYATSISNSGGTSLKWNQHAAAEIQLDSRNSEMLNGAVIQPVPRPACSYSCLIAMALKASSAGSLPVNEIYRFIEREYPFYKTAPDGWKNSIRHNLSLNASFCKAERPDGLQMKKGCYWMITPERRHIVESEIQRFLMQEGRNLIENGDPPNTTNQPTYCAQPMKPRADTTTTTAPKKGSSSRKRQAPSCPPPPPSPSPSYANYQKMNEIFGINWDPYVAGNPCVPYPYSYYQYPYGMSYGMSYGTPMGPTTQELFDFSPSLVGSLDDSKITQFNSHQPPSIYPDHVGGYIYNSHPEDTLPNAYTDLEYWTEESPLPSPTSSSYCSSSSSASSLKAVEKILTNINASQPPLPHFQDADTQVKSSPSEDLDNILTRMVEEHLNDPRNHLPDEEELSAISPIASSSNLLSPYPCDNDDDLNESNNNDCSLMDEDEEDRSHSTRGKYVPSSQDDGALLCESIYENLNQESFLNEEVVNPLTNHVEELLENIFQDTESAFSEENNITTEQQYSDVDEPMDQ